jgi:hypothetical protein
MPGKPGNAGMPGDAGGRNACCFSGSFIPRLPVSRPFPGPGLLGFLFNNSLIFATLGLDLVSNQLND